MKQTFLLKIKKNFRLGKNKFPSKTQQDYQVFINGIYNTIVHIDTNASKRQLSFSSKKLNISHLISDVPYNVFIDERKIHINEVCDKEFHFESTQKITNLGCKINIPNMLIQKNNLHPSDAFCIELSTSSIENGLEEMKFICRLKLAVGKKTTKHYIYLPAEELKKVNLDKTNKVKLNIVFIANDKHILRINCEPSY